MCSQPVDVPDLILLHELAYDEKNEEGSHGIFANPQNYQDPKWSFFSSIQIFTCDKILFHKVSFFRRCL